MNKYSFSNSERYAVYTIHTEKCYLCTKPIDLASMEVDHILPEQLLENKKLLKSTLESFGLPDSYNINSYENWMPSCRRCNNKKSQIIFKPTPIVQIELQKAKNKAKKVEKLVNDTVSKQKVSRALNIVKQAFNSGELSDSQIEEIQPLIKFHDNNRSRDLKKKEFKVTPTFKVRHITQKLKRELFSIYDSSCQICGIQGQSLLQICSIKPLSFGGEASLSNLLLLCPNHHSLLDRGLITINNDYTLMGTSGKLNLDETHEISLESLEWHRKNIFKDTI